MNCMFISEIIEICDWEAANQYLSAGWKLINTYNTIDGFEHPGCDHQTPHYCLGWVGEAPRHPKLKKREVLEDWS